MTRGLDEILSGAEPVQETTTPVEAVTPAEAEPTTETQEKAEQPRAPDGKFAPKEANEPDESKAEAEPAPTAEKPQGKVPQQALHAAREKERAERERAEKLERELAELRGRVEGMSQPRQPEPEPEKKVEFWEAPDKFVESALTPLQQEIIADRLYYSQRAAVTEFGADTVEAAKEALKAAVTSGQVDGNSVAATLRQHRDPIRYIVEWHKRTPEVQETELRARLEAEIREKLMAELGQTQPTAEPAPAVPTDTVMPSNLAGARNVAPRSGPAWSGPAPLNDIFDRSRKKAG